jgi:UDP-glucose 4-epimerase
MTNKLKTNSLHILKLNNQTYIPFQPHNLPSYFHKIDISQIIKYKSYTYINLNSLKKSLQYYTNNITFNKTLNTQLIHQK